jgi:hypothetical protein
MGNFPHFFRLAGLLDLPGVGGGLGAVVGAEFGQD